MAVPGTEVTEKRNESAIVAQQGQAIPHEVITSNVPTTLFKIPLAEWLHQRETSGALDDLSNHSYFKERGHKRLDSGFSRQVAEDLQADTEREKTILSTAIFRGLLFDLIENLPEPHRNDIQIQGLTLGLQMRGLKYSSSDERLGFIRGICQLFLEGKGDTRFFYTQIVPLLYYATSDEKVKLFHTIANRFKGSKSKKAKSVLSLIIGSAKDLDELTTLTQKITPSKLLRLKFHEHIAWANFGSKMQIQSRENKNGDNSYEKLQTLRGELEQRIKICRANVHLRQTECAKKFIRIAHGNLKLIDLVLARQDSIQDRSNQLKFLDLKIRLEFRYGLRFLNEKDKDGTTGARWTLAQLQETEKALSQVPIRFFRTTPKLDVLRRVHITPDAVAERDPDTGEIRISGDICDKPSLRARPKKLSNFALYVVHELAHSIQLGNDKKIRVVSQSVPTIERLVKEQLADSNSSDRIASVVALLCEARSINNLRKIIDDVGLERLKEEHTSQPLRELIAASLINRLSIPPTDITRFSSQRAIERRFAKIREALASYQLELESESEHRDTGFVKAQLVWTNGLVQYLDSVQARLLSLNELRKFDGIMSFLIKLSRGYGVMLQASTPEAWQAVETLAGKQFIQKLCAEIPKDAVTSFVFPTVITLGAELEGGNLAIVDPEQKLLKVFLPSQDQSKLKIGDYQQALRKVQHDREALLTSEHRFQARVRSAKARVLGPTNPWFDLRGYLRISGWTDMTNHPAVKIYGTDSDAYCTIGGKLAIFDWPLTLDGEKVMLTYNKYERLLFRYNTREKPEHEPWLYARTDPWEDWACHFAKYVESPDLIKFAPNKFDFIEMVFRAYEESPEVRGKLVQTILDTRKINLSGDANVFSTN